MANCLPEPAKKIESVLRQQTNWKCLWFYQKTVVLYQMTYAFTRRFLPTYGDRTVDQMVQAARSGKQNIVEGSADGVTSMELELKLLNVARSSIQELQEDYEDYLIKHDIDVWDESHLRFEPMLAFCRSHNRLKDYQPYFERWTDEEAANTALTLCHMVDKMLMSYQKRKEKEFIEGGGIRERMTAARLHRRATQQQEIDHLKAQVQALQAEVTRLRALLAAHNIPL